MTPLIALPSRRLMSRYAARTASSPARPSAIPPRSVLWTIAGPTAFMATGNPIPRAAATASSSLAADTRVIASMPNAFSTGVDVAGRQPSLSAVDHVACLVWTHVRKHGNRSARTPAPLAVRDDARQRRGRRFRKHVAGNRLQLRGRALCAHERRQHRLAGAGRAAHDRFGHRLRIGDRAAE